MRRVVTYCTSMAFVAAACTGSPVEATTLDQPGSSSDAGGSSGATTAAIESSGGDATGTSTATATIDPVTSDPATSTPTGTDADTSGSDPTGDESSSSTGGGSDRCHLLLDEVFHDAEGEDDGLEWLELYNPCAHPIDLAGYSLAWGGMTYASTLDLEGPIAAGGCFVVGGPMSNATNASPAFDQTAPLDLENNTNAAADAVALFDVPAATVEKAGAIPIDALIYGEMNENGLIDETGAVGDVDVPPADPGQAFARVDPAVDPDAWEITSVPSPGQCPNP